MRRMTLGQYPLVTLEAARELARRALTPAFAASGPTPYKNNAAEFPPEAKEARYRDPLVSDRHPRGRDQRMLDLLVPERANDVGHEAQYAASALKLLQTGPILRQPVEQLRVDRVRAVKAPQAEVAELKSLYDAQRRSGFAGAEPAPAAPPVFAACLDGADSLPAVLADGERHHLPIGKKRCVASKTICTAQKLLGSLGSSP